MITTPRLRDARIDIIRGAAMLTIVINHITEAFKLYGFTGLEIVTPTALGYSSSASLFVIMSGYMVGLVYIKKPKPSQALLRRALSLYWHNALLLTALFPIIILMSEIEAAKWRADLIITAPMTALITFFGLLKAPVLLDVLQMYVIFMLLTPAALWVHRKSPLALAAVSITLWILCQLATATHLLDPDRVRSTFNPVAWQLLFFIPLILGAKRIHESIFDLLENRKWITFVIMSIAAIFAMAKIYHVEEAIHGSRILMSKGNLGALRIVHAVVIITLYCGLLTLSKRIPKLPPIRALACLGRQTLKCYVFSAFLTYLLAVAWDRLDGGNEVYYATVALAVMVTFIAAAIFDARSARQVKPALSLVAH